jgi:hypothetical protein
MKKEILILLVFLSMAGPSCFLGAQNARAQARYRPEMTLPSHYPEFFDGFGRVDRIEGDQIVINDRLLRLSSRFTFSTMQSQRAPRELIKEGDIVGFVLNSSKEVTGIYLLGPKVP